MSNAQPGEVNKTLDGNQLVLFEKLGIRKVNAGRKTKNKQSSIHIKKKLITSLEN
jgi:hypothetical protein